MRRFVISIFGGISLGTLAWLVPTAMLAQDFSIPNSLLFGTWLLSVALSSLLV